MNSFYTSSSCNNKPSKINSDTSLNIINKKISKEFNLLNDLRRNSKQQQYSSFLDKITEFNSEKSKSISKRRRSSIKTNKTPKQKKSYFYINDKDKKNFKCQIKKNTNIIPDFQKIQENLRQTIIKMNLEIKKKYKELEHTLMPTCINDLSPISKKLRHVVSINAKKSKEIKTFCKNVLSDSSTSNNDVTHSPINDLKIDKKGKKINKNSDSVSIKHIKKKNKKHNKKNNTEKIYRNLISKQKVFDSLDDDESEEDIEPDGIYISTDNILILILDYVVLFCSLYTMIFIPIEIFKNNSFCEYSNNLVYYFKYFIDIIYIYDFLISFFRGYYDDNCQMVKSNKKIFINYLQNDFLFDLIGALPINYLSKKWCDINIKTFSYVINKKLITYKMLMLLKSIKIIKVLALKHNQPIQNFLGYIEGNFFLFKLVSMSIFILNCIFCMHFLICFHIFISNQYYPNWISVHNFQNYSFLENYINSLYFIITTMTTVGYGDIVGISLIERIFQIILLAIGSIAYSYILSTIGTYAKNENHAQIKYAKDSNILEEIRISYPSMPFKLYNKIYKHLILRTKKECKLDLNILISSLPYTLKNNILFSVYNKIIKNFKIFKNIEHSEFITEVLTCFIPIFTKKDNYLIVEGEMVENMIFVKDGKLSLEATINIDEPEKSIIIVQKNFEWVIEIEDSNDSNSLNDKSPKKSSFNVRSFSSAKNELNILFSNERIKGQNNIYNMNTSFEESYFYREMGKIDFCEEGFKNYGKQIEYHFLKIIEIQKNEYFGDICVVTRKPSPLSLKVKSKNAQVLLLCKKDVLVISKTFPNIWKKINKKSYKNLISIKKLTFNVLKNYYKNFGGLLRENGGIFLNSFSGFNSKESIKPKSKDGFNFQSNSEIINLKNIKFSSSGNSSDTIKKNTNKNKKGAKQDKKEKKEINTNSNSNKTDEQINFSNLLYSQLNKDSKRKIFLNDGYEISEIKEDKKIDNSFFSGEVSNSKNLKFLNSNSNTQINQTAFFFPNKSISKDGNESNNQKDNINKTPQLKSNKCNNIINTNLKNNNSNENLDFITMNDIPSKFMSRIKKKLYYNKKKEKIKRTIKILKNFLEQNKNFIQNIEKTGFFSDQESALNNQIIQSRSILSQFQKIINLDDNDSDSYFEKTVNEFDFLKISKQFSFNINSSYENINEIYHGKLITNQKYKDELKNLITQNLNKTNSNIDIYMQSFNSPSLILKRTNNEDYKKNKLIEYRKSLVTFAMGSGYSVNKYFVASNKSNIIFNSINNTDEDNYNKNKKNILNDRINNTNSSLINKPMNSIDKLNNEKNVNEPKSINLNCCDILDKNQKNIQSSNGVDDVISSIPNLNYSQFNLNNQREMECEINNENNTYNAKFKNNLSKIRKCSEDLQKDNGSKNSNKRSSVSQISNGKRCSLISQYKDKLDRLKIISGDNYYKFYYPKENKCEVDKINKNKCSIF